jgi:general secretion pathway protein F
MGLPGKQPVDLSPNCINPPGVYDWYFFTVELQTALSAGMPFVRAVSIVASDSHKRTIRRAGNIILQHLQKSSASKAVSQASAIPPLIRHMLVVGLRGGDAGSVLRLVVDHYGWLLDIRGQILRVTAYPSILLILGTGVMIMRDTAIATLTGKATTVDAAREAAYTYALPVLLGAVAAVIFAWILYLPGIRGVYDRIILTAPVIGKTVRQYSQAVFFRVLGILVEAGMPITDAWITAGRVMPNLHMARSLEPGLRFLRDGEPLEEAMRQTKLLDRDGRAMAAVGEAAGSIPGLLQRYSAYREMELRSRVKMMTSLLGLPCLAIIAMGYFISPVWLAVLAFLLVFIRRMI